MPYVLKVHHAEKGHIVAACDTAVLGKTFKEGSTTLHVKKTFYDDGEATLDEIISATEHATTTNFVGEDLITALIDKEIVSEDEVHHVDGVPHVQMFFV